MSVLDKFLDAIRLNDDYDEDDEFFDDDDIDEMDEAPKPKKRFFKKMADDDLDDDEIYIESIKSSKMRTAIIVKHIQDMLSMYEIFCERSDNEEERRRYRVLKMRYIDDPGINVGEIAEQENVAIRTVYKDLDKAIKRLSALIFGIDGISFDNSAKSGHTKYK